MGNGTITGDRLLDALDTVVTYKIATIVSSSWFEGYMPVPASMITAWEGVLQRAAVEGIGVNFATGDFGDDTPLQYPGSDPWITLVGGTSLAVGKNGNALWEAGWETDQANLGKNGQSWNPAPPGFFSEGSTGITGNPQGPGVTEATVFGIGYQMPPTLSVMGQCGDTRHLACGAGDDTVSGLGSPGPAFFRSFGSKPR